MAGQVQQLGWRQDFAQRYVLGKRVGEGSNAFVNLAHSRITGRRSAVKTLQKVSQGKPRKDFIIREIEMLRVSQGSERVLALEDLYETKDTAMILTEYLSGGDLWQNIQLDGLYDEQHTKEILRSLLLALQHCHNRSILMGDVKPNNIVLRKRGDSTSATLVDFGCSKIIKGFEKHYRVSGTPMFMPPESLIRPERPAYQTLLSDLYCAGVTMSVISTGKLPVFEIGKNDNWLISVCRELPGFSKAAHDVLCSLLAEDTGRPSAEALLQHPWFA